MESNIAVLWDIENVTPNAKNSLFTDAMREYAESIGRVVISYAYADWSRPPFKTMGPQLAEQQFFMVHVPYKTKRTNKNGSDMHLVSDALDLLRFYEHIDTFILITGDSDFRPLLLTLRRSGKKTYIICDINTASQDLLEIADEFKDYRSLLPTAEEASNEKDEETKLWFRRLAETVQILRSKGKNPNLSTLKVQMKILYSEFNEQQYGFTKWSHFVTAAIEARYVRIEDDIIHAQDPQRTEANDPIQEAFQILVNNLTKEDISYAKLAQILQSKINIGDLGFKRLKDFISAAEARGLVETSVNQFSRYCKLRTSKNKR